MANLKHTLLCMSIILCMCMFISCFANDHRELYITYMGSLPKGEYSPNSHHLDMLQQVMGDNFASHHLIRSYKRSFNGFAAKLTRKEMQNLAMMEGVVSVFQSKTMHLETTRSWEFMGFNDKTREASSVESDIIIGVIDTGIWPESESFNDQGFSPAPKKWKGTCDGGKNFTCNNKIIGARYYSIAKGDGSARDLVGHGSHTASTAAGNKVKGASFYGIAEGIARGGVPSARIAAYKVCNDDKCDEADILAAFDDAIADGVDIITISIGDESTHDLTKGVIAIGSFHALEAGILTVQSAGNNGPERGSTTSVAPWLMTVAASTIDRKIIDKISLGSRILTLSSRQSVNGFASNGTRRPLVLGEHVSFPQCAASEGASCSPSCLDPQKVKGKIILCSAGYGAQVGYAYGAFGSIVESIGGIDVALVVPYPTVAIDEKAYAIALSYVNKTSSPQAEILRSDAIRDPNAPVIAEFSSRGPNTIVPEIMKPDISAPGVEILAAFSPVASPSGDPKDKRSVKYNIESGTSMSCPHVAGVAAYVRSFHPDWSPAAIKSSIMTTATPMGDEVLKEFAYGSGHVNPIRAVDPGLVFDISKNDYVNFLCNIGYDTPLVRIITGDNSTCSSSIKRSTAKDINYPSIAIQVPAMQPFAVYFTRTVTNVGFANSTYKVSVLQNSNMNITVDPQFLSFKSLNEKQSFVVNIVGGKFPMLSVLSSSIVWTDGKHTVRSPIVVDVAPV